MRLTTNVTEPPLGPTSADEEGRRLQHVLAHGTRPRQCRDDEVCELNGINVVALRDSGPVPLQLGRRIVRALVLLAWASPVGAKDSDGRVHRLHDGGPVDVTMLNREGGVNRDSAEPNRLEVAPPGSKYE